MKLKFLILLTALLTPFMAHAADFEVKGYGVHAPAGVTYHYTVMNNVVPVAGVSPQYIFEVQVGWHNDPAYGPNSTSKEPAALPDLGSFVPVMTSPAGWNANIGGWHGEPGHVLVWRADRGTEVPMGKLLPAGKLRHGQTLTGFSVTAPRVDPAYLDKFFVVTSSDYDPTITNSVNGFRTNGRIVRMDVLPPTLSVTLTPNTLKANDKLVSIVAAITVADNYDPASAIKLESITANEPLDRDDISGAAFGTDDRQFKLKAEREGKNKAGRIYTVTYSATDASGNKATASATVTVPHDERKKDDDKDEREKKDK